MTEPIIINTSEKLLEIFGKVPENNEISVIALMQWLNTPQDHEPDEEK